MAAITLTTEYQRVAYYSEKITTNTTQHMELQLKAEPASNGHTVYGRVYIWTTNPYGDYDGWSSTATVSWTGTYNGVTVASGSRKGISIISNKAHTLVASGSHFFEHTEAMTKTAKVSGSQYGGTKTASNTSVTLSSIRLTNTVSTYQPDGTTANGLLFDLTTSSGVSSQGISNYVLNEMPGVSATVSNIRSNVTGAHYTTNNITNDGSSSFTWIIDTANKAVKIYSGWDTYAVNYTAPGASSVPSSQTKIYNTVLVLSNEIPIMPSTEMNGHTVYFNGNGGSATYSSYTTTDTIMNRFEAWQAEDGTVYYPGDTYSLNEPLRLSASWSTHTDRGGVEFPYITRPGCEFLGWSRSLTDIEYVEPGYIPEEDETLYAIWLKNPKIYTTSTLLGGLVLGVTTVDNITPFTFDVNTSATLPIVRNITYSFSIDGGTTWTPYQSSPDYEFTGLAEETTYSLMVRAKALHEGVDSEDVVVYTETPISVTTLADQARIWIKVNNVWVKGKAYIKVNGVWKKAKKLYIKKNGVWVVNKNN